MLCLYLDMIQLFKKADDNPSQFLKLYSSETDFNDDNLFGWLNTYPSDDPQKMVEEWLYVKAESRDLYNTSFQGIPQPQPVPSNQAEWKKSIANGPEFKAYTKRLSEVIPYTPSGSGANGVFTKMGKLAFGISNNTQPIPNSNLIQITLRSNLESAIGANNSTRYEQISLMATMEANMPWLNYSDCKSNNTIISFEQFILDGGVKELGLVIPLNKIEMINFETVWNYNENPISVINKNTLMHA